MHRMPTRWSRAGGFAPVPQNDTPDEDGGGDQRQRKVTRKDFSNQVQRALRRSALQQEQEDDHMSVQGSVHSSPAFSDTPLIGGDYLDVPIRHYDEVDLDDYIEYHGYYGPELANLAQTPSVEAGVGLEVCSGPAPSNLTPGGFHVDDSWSHLSYRGSEGKIEEDFPGKPHNYKPPVLRKRFLLIFFVILAILVGLAELAIQLLPDNSDDLTPPQLPNGTVEIRPRSNIVGRISLSYPAELFKRQNNTSIGSPTSTATTKITSSFETTPDITPTTPGNEITTENSFTPTSPIIPTFPGEDVSTDTTETSAPSITDSFTSSPPEISSPTSSSPPTEQPLPPTSIPPASPTSGNPLPTSPPEASLPSSSPTFPSSVAPTHPGHQEPSSAVPTHPGHQESTSLGNPWPPHTTDPATLTSNTITQPDTSLPLTFSTWPPSPNDPPSPTAPDPPNSGPAHPSPPPASPTTNPPTETMPTFTDTTDATITSTFPTETMSTRSPSSGPGPDPPTTSSTVVPTFSSVDSSETNTYSSTLPPTPPSTTTTSEIEIPSTSTGSPEIEPSSTQPDPPTDSATPTEQSFSSTSSSIGSSSVLSTDTTTKINTNVPLPTTPKPFATITIAPDTQPPPPPITTTIITSVTQISGIFIETTLVSVINVAKANADNVVTDYVTVLSDSHGNPTKTQTILAQISIGTGSVFLYFPYKTTLTDYQGSATKTEDYYISTSTLVLYDKNGRPTATRSLSVKETVSLTTLFDGNGVATETKTELVPMSSTIIATVKLPSSTASPNVNDSIKLHVIPISNGKYFLGLMFPTLIAILVSIPIRIIDQNARLYQPFHALVSSRGAKACDTLCFPTSSTWNVTSRVRALLNGQALLTLTGLLVLGSVIMIPLSAEAVGIILQGPDCVTTKGDSLTCSMALAVYLERAQIAVALLALMVILVGLVIIVLRKWNTGVKENPWSLFQMVHLAANSEIKTLTQRRLRETNGRISNSQMAKAFEGISFVLDYWKDNGVLKYSILIPNEAHSLKKEVKAATCKRGKAVRHRKKGETAHTMPFFILTWTGRLLFLALLCGVEIGLLVYIITGDGQGYVQFMMGRWRVVRFIFIFIGVMILLIWDAFFQAVAFLSPHKLFYRIRLYHGDAGKMTPPTNAFGGIRSSLSPGRRDVYLGIVSFTSILIEVLPLLLSISLDKCTETFWAHTVCLWMAVSLLSVMILTVAGSFFVSWPHMPIDPSIIAGEIYYAINRYSPMSPSSGLLFGRVSPGVV